MASCGVGGFNASQPAQAKPCRHTLAGRETEAQRWPAGAAIATQESWLPGAGSHPGSQESRP